jgi:hypothetical protein
VIWLVSRSSLVKVDAGGDQHDENGGGDPVNDKAERRPPASVGNKVAPVLPEVLDPMAGKAEHEQPRRSGDACRSNHDKDCCDPGLDGDDGPSSVSDGEADVDRCDQGQRERVDGRRIKPPKASGAAAWMAPKTTPHNTGARSDRSASGPGLAARVIVGSVGRRLPAVARR